MNRTIVTLTALSLLAAGPSRASDAEQGARVFKAQCATCHAITAGRNLVGPSLFGVEGRKAGEVPGFRYSTANKQAGWVWDEARLDQYLADPKAVMPGTSMLYSGLKNDGQRADVVAYVLTLK